VTTAKRLLAAVDGLPYGARQRELAATARSLGGKKLARLLDELYAEGEFARRAGLHLASAAGERAYVERCLSAGQPAVVRTALGAAVRLGLPAEKFVPQVTELPTALRASLYQHVRRRRATELAEALLPVVRARFGDVEAAVLLPVCSAATVTALLGELAYAVTGWRMIGHRHPAVFLRHLDDELAATPRSGWTRLLGTVGSGLETAALTEPDRVLAVLERTAPYAHVPAALARTIGLLARHDPARLLRVLLDPRRPGAVPGGRALWRALLGAGDDDLVAFGRAVGSHRLTRFLRVVPPSRRAAVYAGVVGQRDPTLSQVPIALLDELPADARAAEAERLLALRRVDGDAGVRLAVTARLPWSRAVEPLREATRRATAEERAEGYDVLVRAAAVSRDRGAFAEMLGSLNRLRNEQDPVRARAFAALAQVPPWLYRPAEAPDLLKLMTDAVAARDCSWLTQSHVRTLIARLVRQGALSRQPELVDTALEALTRLGDKRPSMNLYALDRELPRGGEHRVFAALRSRLEADARLGRFEVTLALATGLRRRAWEMRELQALLDRARAAKDDHVVRQAIQLWLAPPRTRDERLGEVFAADRSTITFPVVQNGIALRRTDLLDDVFTKPLHGRFLKRGVRHVPWFGGCFSRWLPRQCAAYVQELAKAAVAHRKRSTHERVTAVRRLATVPGSLALLRSYVDDPELPVSEAALAALAWTDEPAGVLDDLLVHADDDKARVAVYAVTRCARFVPPARLGAALDRLLTSRKVTSRKEAVRLLAAHHAPDAAGTLASVWHEPDQHRDVRRAVVSAARWCLPDAWPLLEEASSAPHAVATAVLDLDPFTLAPAHRQRYAGLVHTVADAAEPDTARRGLATLARWTRWDPAGTRMLVGRVGDLANTASWREALAALVAGCTATEDPAPLADVVARLLATPDGPTTADRDLPVRQRIRAVAELVQRDAHEVPALRAAAGSLADTLAAEPTLRGPTIDLAATAVPFEPDGDGTAALHRVAELADAPRWAWHAHHAVARRLAGRVARLPQAHLYDLATSAPPLLGLAIAGQAGPEAGWPGHWRTYVIALRDHDDTDVRLTALDIYTTRE
jgi:hypothetical protein